MVRYVAAGAGLLLLILIFAAGCVVGLAGDSCGNLPCYTTTVPTAPPVTAATPAAQYTELSRLALPRAEAPFTVADEKFSGSTAGADNEGMTRFGAVRMYQVAFSDGRTDASGRALVQMIVELPPGNVSPFYEYAYQQVLTGNSVRTLASPGIGDRSFAFTATQGQGTSSVSTVTGIVFAKENIVEFLMLKAPDAGSTAIAPLARKAATLVPAGGTVPPAMVAAVAAAATAAPVTTLSRAPAATPGGLLVWYDFNDDFTTSGVVKDRSGSGRDAALTGSVARGNGILGTGGAAFNGNGFFLAPDNPAAGHKEVTFSFWFRTADPTRNYKFASAAEWRGGPGTGWTMATHRPEFWADDGPEDLIVPAQPNTDNEFVPGAWTHEAVVYDGKTMKEYTNGTLINSWQGRNVPMSQGVPMAVGGWPQFSGYNFVGSMDEFRIYDQALTAQEIAQLYREGRG